MEPKFTPDNITKLDDNEVFVFGSNLQGQHCGGAARIAKNLFGAVMGQGVGLQGQSYAIPTMQGGVDTIKPYVDEFIEFAKMHPDLTFYVTRIGCGIAGFQDEDIAMLFDKAMDLPNVILPQTFFQIIAYSHKINHSFTYNPREINGETYHIATANEYPWINVQIIIFPEDKRDESLANLHAQPNIGWVVEQPGRKDFAVIHAGGNSIPLIFNQENYKRIAEDMKECMRNAAKWWADNH